MAILAECDKSTIFENEKERGKPKLCFNWKESNFNIFQVLIVCMGALVNILFLIIVVWHSSTATAPQPTLTPQSTLTPQPAAVRLASTTATGDRLAHELHATTSSDLLAANATTVAAERLLERIMAELAEPPHYLGHVWSDEDSMHVCDGVGWHVFDNKCYKAIGGAFTADGAQAACEAEGANLTSIHFAHERNFVAIMTASLDYVPMQKGVKWGVWIGLRRHHVSLYSYVLKWSDSTPVDYEHNSTAASRWASPSAKRQKGAADVRYRGAQWRRQR